LFDIFFFVPSLVKFQDVKSYSRKIPHSGIPFQPALSHKSTVPEPFGFEERDKICMAQKAAKTEQIYQEEQMVS
jgi:hypothetical protein